MGAPARAQSGGWCGYALIENLPLLDNQLEALAAITPARSASARPNELFQYRWSLDHTKVIVEGCFQTYPTRDIVVSLLASRVNVNVKAILDQRGADAFNGLLLRGGVTQGDLNRAYVEEQLQLSLFAPGGTHDESAAAVRAYLQTNAKEWEPPAP